jgi:hypothetical protein
MQRVLRDLYRRGLFLTALDEVTPVLRFHDLFREFLKTELWRRHGDEPTSPTRAPPRRKRYARALCITTSRHQWDRALALIVNWANSLMEGAIGTMALVRTDSPGGARQQSMAYLLAAAGCVGMDARAATAAAIAGLTAPNELPRRVRALFQLVMR